MQGRTRAQNLKDRFVCGEAVCKLMTMEVKQALLMLASRPLDPATLALRRDSPIIYDRFRNSPTLRTLFNHPFFQSEAWANIKRQVRAAEDSVHVEYESLGVQNRNEMTSFCRTIQRTQRQQHVASQQQFHSICTRLDAIQQGHVSNNLLTLPQSQAETGSDSNNSSQQVVPISESVVTAMNASGTKKMAIGEEFILSAEPVVDGEQPRISLKECDRHFNSAREYYNLWENTFKPLEEKDTMWRTDRAFISRDESGAAHIVEPRNARNTWFSSRRIIWEFIDHLRNEKGYTREDAIEAAENVYNQARTGSNQTANRKLMTKKFSEAYKAQGGTGRKRGRKSKATTAGEAGRYKRIRQSNQQTLTTMNVHPTSTAATTTTTTTPPPSHPTHQRVATSTGGPVYFGRIRGPRGNTDPVVFEQAFQDTPLTEERIAELRENERHREEQIEANLRRRAAEERWRAVENQFGCRLYGGSVPPGRPGFPNHRFSHPLVFHPQEYRLHEAILPPREPLPVDAGIGDVIPTDMQRGHYGGGSGH